MTNQKARNSMKVRGTIVMVMMLAVAGLMGMLQVSYPAQAYKPGTIGATSAQTIALDHAGLNRSQVWIDKTAFYQKRGVYRFDVQFRTTAKKYNYEIEAYTGEVIVYYEKNIGGGAWNNNPGNSGSGNENSGGTGIGTAYISEADAKDITLKHAGVSSSSLRDYEGKLKMDKGIMVYKIEFETKLYEYEYKINAQTGAILKVEKDRA